MYLWWVNYFGEEWGCYVIAKTRGKAKLMFGSYFGRGEWNDIRSTRLKVANGYAAALFTQPDGTFIRYEKYCNECGRRLRNGY